MQLTVPRAVLTARQVASLPPPASHSPARVSKSERRRASCYGWMLHPLLRPTKRSRKVGEPFAAARKANVSVSKKKKSNTRISVAGRKFRKRLSSLSFRGCWCCAAECGSEILYRQCMNGNSMYVQPVIRWCRTKLAVLRELLHLGRLYGSLFSP